MTWHNRASLHTGVSWHASLLSVSLARLRSPLTVPCEARQWVPPLTSLGGKGPIRRRLRLRNETLFVGAVRADLSGPRLRSGALAARGVGVTRTCAQVDEVREQRSSLSRHRQNTIIVDAGANRAVTVEPRQGLVDPALRHRGPAGGVPSTLFRRSAWAPPARASCSNWHRDTESGSDVTSISLVVNETEAGLALGLPTPRRRRGGRGGPRYAAWGPLLHRVTLGGTGAALGVRHRWVTGPLSTSARPWTPQAPGRCVRGALAAAWRSASPFVGPWRTCGREPQRPVAGSCAGARRRSRATGGD